jgi:hypothetical protein
MEYDLKNNNLHLEENIIPAYSLEKNRIGNCSNCEATPLCEATLLSLSYHAVDNNIIVITKCTSCGAFQANIYDSEWNWLEEVQVSLLPIRIPISNPIIDSLEGLKGIPIEKIEVIFNRAEIEAIFASAKNETPIRKHLSRARRKYSIFEKIFDLRLEF